MQAKTASFSVSVPDYTINELIIGHRGTSVYRGYHTKNETPVILKVVVNQLASKHEATRLSHEFNCLHQLTSDYTPKALDFIRFDSGSALIQQDMGLHSLHDVLAQSDTLDFEIGLQLALGLTRAIRDIHSQSIIHKDINPSNIIWHADADHPSIIDFGISTHFSHQRYQFGSTRGIEGTLKYIAPEQTGRMNRELDYRSDFYSLGIVLYELFTGSCPFEDTDALAVIHAHLAVAPQPAIECNAQIPPCLSAVINKLLAKSPGDRYQSTYGIEADLEYCLAHLTPPHDSFVPGNADKLTEFQLPQRLYGRSQQQKDMVEAYQKIATGGRHLLTIAGLPGIGKSALVQESHIEITRAGGYYCAGKFDQLQRTTPYSALIQACTHLLQQTVLSDEGQEQDWCEKLQKALGHNAQVMIDFLPELMILGVQEPIQTLGPVETQNRFKRVFTNFLEVFCQAGHPLLLFLDDLQWADLGTLNLLEHLLSQSELKHLLVVGCYRNNEVSETHPLHHFLQNIQEQTVSHSSMELGPLDFSSIHEMVTDLLPSLSCSHDELTHLLLEKTNGNPFFLGQFLYGLYQKEFLYFDESAKHWQLDITTASTSAMTDNVVDYMVDQLHQLPHNCQRALAAASCIGNHFDVNLLSHILDTETISIHEDLRAAVEHRLIAPDLDSLNCFTDQTNPQTGYLSYSFIHDRIQQAAHLLTVIDPSQIHYRIGKLLLAEREEHSDIDYLFNLVDHLNSAPIGNITCFEGQELVCLNLEATRAAIQATAYDAALSYLQACEKHLLREHWSQFQSQAYQLCFHMAETYYLLNQRENSAPWMTDALTLAETKLEKAAVHNLAVTYLAMNGQYHESLDRALETLRYLGVDIDITNPEAAISAVFQDIESRVDETQVAALYDREDVTDPVMKYAMKILAEITSVSYAIDKRIFVLVNAHTVLLALKHGLCADAAPSIACLGLLYNAMFGKPELGCEYGKLGRRLGDRYEDLAQRSKAYDWFCNFTVVWNEPIENTVSLNREALGLALDTGDLPFAGFIVNHMAYNGFYMGMNLNELEEASQGYLDFLDRISHYYAYDCVQGILWAIDYLRGNAYSNMRIPHNKETFLARCKAPETMFPLGRYLALLTQIYVLDNNPEAAWETAQDSETHLVDVTGTISVAGQSFYYVMAGVLYADTLPESEQEAHIKALKDKAQVIYGWAQRCPASFAHMAELLNAEWARLDGQHEQALQHYDQAISEARTYGNIHDEALACERAAHFWQAQGKDRLALPYIREAYQAHEQWGCHRRAGALEQQIPALSHSQDNRTVTKTLTRTLSDSIANQDLDLVELLRAVRVISEAANLDQLMDRMMHLLLEDAGASRGCLFLSQNKELYLEASAQAGNLTVETYINEPVDVERAITLLQLPGKLIHDVCTENQYKLINKQSDLHGFYRSSSSEPAACSAIALPLRKQNELYGIIYLENQDLEDAFTEDRIQILNALAGQMVVSIENARLYEDLENRVQARTQELEQTNSQLQLTNDQLNTQIEEREKAQRERDAIQAQLLDTARHAGMAEIATGVLHNIGNAINSVSVRIHACRNAMADLSKLRIKDLVYLLETNRQNLAQFLTEDQRGQKIPEYLNGVADMINKHQSSQDKHLLHLEQMLTHVNDIIAWQNNYTGVKGIKEKIEVPQLIHDSLSIIQDSLDRMHVTINTQIDPNLPHIYIEPHKVVQILINLIKNAGQAVEQADRADGSITVKAQLYGKEQLMIEVQDDGIGIAPDKIKEIFQFGYTTKQGSHGFGLHNSVLSAKEMNGTLNVHSDGIGQGATFTLILPCEEPVYA